MQTENTKSKKWTWLVVALVFVAACWLAANWEDFKEGYISGYTSQTGNKP
jgi:hypothetical protein